MGRALRLAAALGLLLALCAAPGLAWGLQAVTIYCDDAYPPYAYAQDGKAAGIYVDVVRAALALMPDYQVTIEPVPWRRGLEMLRRGQGFALLPPYHHPRRRPFIQPYSSPLVREEVVVVCRPEVAQGRRRWPQDFRDLTIGINSGFALGGEVFMDEMKNGRLKVEEAATNQQNLEKLRKGRIQVYVNDRLSILWALAALRAKGVHDSGWVVESMTLGYQWGHLGYAKRAEAFPFKDDFVAKFEAALKQVRQGGLVQASLDRYVRMLCQRLPEGPSCPGGLLLRAPR